MFVYESNLKLIKLVQETITVIIRIFIILKTIPVIILVAIQDTVSIVVVVLVIRDAIFVIILIAIQNTITVIIVVLVILDAVSIIVLISIINAITIVIIIISNLNLDLSLSSPSLTPKIPQKRFSHLNLQCHHYHRRHPQYLSDHHRQSQCHLQHKMSEIFLFFSNLPPALAAGANTRIRPSRKARYARILEMLRSEK